MKRRSSHGKLPVPDDAGAGGSVDADQLAEPSTRVLRGVAPGLIVLGRVRGAHKSRRRAVL